MAVPVFHDYASACMSSAATSSTRSSSSSLERARLRRLLMQPGDGLTQKLIAKRQSALQWRSDHSTFSALNLDGKSASFAEQPEPLRLPPTTSFGRQQSELCHLGCTPRTVVLTNSKARELDLLGFARQHSAPAGATAAPGFGEVRSFLLSFRAAAAADDEMNDETVEVPSEPRRRCIRIGSPPPELRGLVARDSPEMQAFKANAARTPEASARTRPIPSEIAYPMTPSNSSSSATPRITGPPPGTFLPKQVSVSTPAHSQQMATPLARQLSLPAPSPTAYSTVAFARQLSAPLSYEEDLRRTVKALLNKICPENVDSIAEKLASIQVKTTEELETFIELIFAKALAEPHYCETYADLIFKLKPVFPEFPSKAGGRPITFKAVVLNLCQIEFEACPATLELTEEERESMDDQEVEFQRIKRKARMLANMKLVGHLFLRQLLPAKVIGSVVRELLLSDGGETECEIIIPEEHAVECACELLMATGYTLENTPSGKQALTQVCSRLLDLKNARMSGGQSALSKRIQFLVQDLLDCRRLGWTQKVLKSRPKTMIEIRSEQHRDLQNKSSLSSPQAEHVIAGQRPAYLSTAVCA